MLLLFCCCCWDEPMRWPDVKISLNIIIIIIIIVVVVVIVLFCCCCCCCCCCCFCCCIIIINNDKTPDNNDKSLRQKSQFPVPKAPAISPRSAFKPQQLAQRRRQGNGVSSTCHALELFPTKQSEPRPTFPAPLHKVPGPLGNLFVKEIFKRHDERGPWSSTTSRLGHGGGRERKFVARTSRRRRFSRTDVTSADFQSARF